MLLLAPFGRSAATRRFYYACIGLQWSKIFYAEFIVPPKPGINKRGQRGQRRHPPYTPYSTDNSSRVSFKTTRAFEFDRHLIKQKGAEEIK